MKKIWTSMKYNKRLWIFLGIILFFGIGVGVYFAFLSKGTMDSVLANYVLSIDTQSFQFSITHFVILASLFVLSFFLIGIPIGIGYLFYEGLTMGFCATLFIQSFQFGGFFYIILFFLITKLFFLLLFFFYFSKMLKISKCIISKLIYKTDQKDRFIQSTMSCFILIVIMIGVDLFIDIFGVQLISLFSFLLR